MRLYMCLLYVLVQFVCFCCYPRLQHVEAALEHAELPERLHLEVEDEAQAAEGGHL